jgi:WD40 repeat protein/predicted Ser/Thr protein kinase
MSGPPLKRVEELFHQAVALPTDERPAFLGAACGADADLRVAVETLLRCDAEATDVFRASPVAREAGEARLGAATLPRPEARPAAPLPRVPDYEVLRELGRGGMGVVYLARHTPLKRLVALKALPVTSATPEQLERFRTEAEALARLQHPNVVPIYDVGEFEGHPYFTMEYVAGPSLADRLDGRPQDAAAAAELVEVLARAIHAVHQCGIVHRDLKPANVLFQARGLQPTDFGTPKITDFGIAKDRTSARRLTQTGTILGTPCYMAPEQVRDSRGGVGPRADVYALGSILYELLTGRPPFDAATPLEIMSQVLNEEPLPPSRLRPRLPADVATICLKCLEKSPRHRYPSAWDLAEDLRRFRAREPILARPVGPVGRTYRWCLRRPLVAGLLALSASLAVALAVTLVVYDTLLSAKVSEERRQIVQLNIAIGTREMDDGEAFAAVLRFAEALRQDEDDSERASHRGRVAAALRRCPRLLRVQTHDGPVVGTSPGPPRTWVATAGAGHTLEVWDALTGRPAGPVLSVGEAPHGVVIGPDGRWLATISTGGAVRVWDVATGTSHSLPGPGNDPARRVAFPAGDALLTEHADAVIRLWKLTADGPVPLPSQPGGPFTYSALSDDAHWLFTRDASGVGRVWDAATGKSAGAPLQLEQAVKGAAISADGRRLALLDPEGRLRVWDVAEGTCLPVAIRPRQGVRYVALSANGERLVTAGDEERFQVWQVPTGEVFDVMPRRGGPVTYARFSPDGRLIVAGNEAGARVWDAKTGRAVTPPLRHATPHAAAALDGQQLTTVSARGTVCVWDLSPSPEGAAAEPPPDAGTLLALAELMACARIDDNQRRIPLEEEAFRKAWDRLHPAP